MPCVEVKWPSPGWSYGSLQPPFFLGKDKIQTIDYLHASEYQVLTLLGLKRIRKFWLHLRECDLVCKSSCWGEQDFIQCKCEGEIHSRCWTGWMPPLLSFTKGISCSSAQKRVPYYRHPEWGKSLCLSSLDLLLLLIMNTEWVEQCPVGTQRLCTSA